MNRSSTLQLLQDNPLRKPIYQTKINKMAEQSISLDEIRKQIDEVDTELMNLLNRRADLVHLVGVVKKAQGLSIYVPEREESLLQGLEKKNKGRLPAASV